MMHSAFYDSWFCGPGGMFAGMPFGGLFNLLFWGLALYLGYRLIRSLTGGNRPASSGPSGSADPLAILERRYAAGDIDQEEFLQRKKDLGL